MLKEDTLKEGKLKNSKISKALQAHILKYQDCALCPISQWTSSKIFYRGSNKPRYLFVGEAPGDQEDCFGEPFVGPSGKYLMNILKEAEVDENQCGFTNTLICTPYNSWARTTIETPTQDQMKCCRPRLKDLIGILSPEIVIAVGDKAKQSLSKFSWLDYVYIPHPAYLLRLGSLQMLNHKRVVLFLQKELKGGK